MIKIAISSSEAFLTKTKSLVKSFKNPELAQSQLNTVKHFADSTIKEREHIKSLSAPWATKILNSSGGPLERLPEHQNNMRTAVKSFKGK